MGLDDARRQPDDTTVIDAEDAEVEALAAELTEELEAEAARPPKPRRWWAWPARLLVSAAMLWFLVKKIADVSFADLVPEWNAHTVTWLAIALALTLVSIVLSAARWREVLLGMEVPTRFARLLSHYFAGQFVSNVLPTTIGGDVLRVSRLSSDTGDVADSFASVVIERLTGWLVLPILSFTGFALNGGLRGLGDASRWALLVGVVTLVALFGILFVADHPKLGGRFQSKEGWRRFIGAVHLGVARLRHKPVAATRIIVVGIAFQFMLVLAASAAAVALGIADTVSVTVMLAFLPAVLILQVLPIGIGGLGVREGALVLFLSHSALGVPEAQAVSLGLTLFVLNLVASLAGAPAFLAGSRTRGGATAEPEPAA